MTMHARYVVCHSCRGGGREVVMKYTCNECGAEDWTMEYVPEPGEEPVLRPILEGDNGGTHICRECKSKVAA